MNASTFLEVPGIIFDVRSPAEYMQGHIPGAINLPLFDNQERAVIGTLYKQTGKEEAFLEGLRVVGPKMAEFVEKACLAAPDKKIRVYCWRGGMRSGSMSWLLQSAGFGTCTLQGGYKAFRKWALNSFEIPRPLKMIGGLTGSGKTAFLHELECQGEAILDLEKLACHRGSAFGMIGMPQQPSCEQFENLIAMKLAQIPLGKTIWIEDESRNIGTCHIPDAFFAQMRKAPVYLIEKPVEDRIEQLIQDYGDVPQEIFAQSVLRLERKLGGQRTKEILCAERRQAIAMLLEYYDKAYLYNLKKENRTTQTY